MEYSEVEASVRKLARDRHEQSVLAASASHKAAALAKILAAYVEMFPELEEVATEVSGDELPGAVAADDPPRGAEAVRIVLQDDTKVTYLVSEMVDALRNRGWLPDSTNPANAVRAALDRLASDDDSDVHKVRYGDRTVRYVYDPDKDRSQPLPTRPAYDDEEPI